jgi:hypothetical protein
MLPVLAVMLGGCMTIEDTGRSNRTYRSYDYGPSIGRPYYYDPWVRPRERERNRDHSRFFYPEKGVRCDRATQVCDKYRGKADGFIADPSETKDYFGKKARRRLHQELGTSK